MSQAQGPAGWPFLTTFYSYKGGAGRSVACANTAHQLAALGHTCAVLDFDVESVGQGFIHDVPEAWMQPNLADKPVPERLYVQDMLSGTARGAAGAPQPMKWQTQADVAGNLRRLLVDVTSLKPERYQGFDLGSPGSAAGRSLLMLSRFGDEPGTLPDTPGSPARYLSTFLNRVAGRIEHVLFDSPSGTQSYADLAWKYSRVIVVLCRLSSQFVLGTRDFLKRLVRTWEADRPLDVLVVPSCVPIDKASQPARDDALRRLGEHVEEASRLAVAQQRNALSIRLASQAPGSRDAGLLLPEVTSLKWRDAVLPAPGSKTPRDEVEGYQAFRKLALVLEERRQAAARPGGLRDSAR